GKDPELLAALAAVEARAGLAEEAVETLEDANFLPGVKLDAELTALRCSYLPDLLTFRSIDAALDRQALEAIIPQHASLTYFPRLREPSPGLAWTEGAFDDSSWASGPTPIGVAMACRTMVSEMKTAASTVYVRCKFKVIDPKRYHSLLLSVRADD